MRVTCMWKATGKNRFHVQKYGHPSEFGFKDVIHAWKAERNGIPTSSSPSTSESAPNTSSRWATITTTSTLWAQQIPAVELRRDRAQKDIIGGWAKQRARAQGLPFGNQHPCLARLELDEPAQGADKNGPKAGVPYDGKLTKAGRQGEMVGRARSAGSLRPESSGRSNFQSGPSFHARLHWGNGISSADLAYCQNFYNRTADLIKKYQPDLLYSTTRHPAALARFGRRPQDRGGFLQLESRQVGGGRSEGVLFGKILTDDRRNACVWTSSAACSI